MTGFWLWQLLEQEEQTNLRGACVCLCHRKASKWQLRTRNILASAALLPSAELFHCNDPDNEKEMPPERGGAFTQASVPVVLGGAPGQPTAAQHLFFGQIQAVDASRGLVPANRHRLPSASWMNTPLSSPSADKIRSQCPQGPRGRSYIIKYTEGGRVGGFEVCDTEPGLFKDTWSGT